MSTPAEYAKVLPVLLRRIPATWRAWIYLALFVAGVVALVTSWVQSGLSVEQIGLALVTFALGLARANVQ